MNRPSLEITGQVERLDISDGSVVVVAPIRLKRRSGHSMGIDHSPTRSLMDIYATEPEPTINDLEELLESDANRRICGCKK